MPFLEDVPVLLDYSELHPTSTISILTSLESAPYSLRRTAYNRTVLSRLSMVVLCSFEGSFLTMSRMWWISAEIISLSAAKSS